MRAAKVPGARRIGYSDRSKAADKVLRESAKRTGKRVVRRAASPYAKKLGRKMKQLNRKARKKDGNYRKGWNASRVLRQAHKEIR